MEYSTANTWYHICGVRDSAAGLLRVFVNGVEENTAAAGAAPVNTTQALQIGRSAVGGGSRYFEGMIEDVRIYNRTLTASKIANIFNAKGKDKNIDGLQRRWMMQENTTQATATGAGTVVDKVNGITGTPTNTPNYADSHVSNRSRSS